MKCYNIHECKGNPGPQPVCAHELKTAQKKLMWCPFSTNPQTILPLLHPSRSPFLSNIHLLTLPPSSRSISLAVSDPGPVTERRGEQLLCVHSSDDGVIQQKSNRQRPNPSLHLSLHLRLSLLFVDQMLPVCSPLCPSLVWLIAGFLFLDSQGYSLFTCANINQSRIYNKYDPYKPSHLASGRESGGFDCALTQSYIT